MTTPNLPSPADDATTTDVPTRDVSQDPAPQQPFTVTHKWPWRAGEFSTMAFFAVLCFGIGYITNDRWGTLTGAIAALGVVALLYRTKTRRVNESAATATLTGTRLAVASNGALGRSAVNLSKVTTIGYRRFGSDECFMLSDGTQAVRLPVRLLATPELREPFETVWATTRDIAPSAHDLYPRIDDRL